MKSLERRRSHCSKNRVTANALKIKLPFSKRILDVSLGPRLLSIPRALRVYIAVDSSAPIFKMAFFGDIEGIQTALAEGMSPFVVDDEGHTLLHVRSIHIVAQIRVDFSQVCFEVFGMLGI